MEVVVLHFHVKNNNFPQVFINLVSVVTFQQQQLGYAIKNPWISVGHRSYPPDAELFQSSFSTAAVSCDTGKTMLVEIRFVCAAPIFTYVRRTDKALDFVDLLCISVNNPDSKEKLIFLTNLQNCNSLPKPKMPPPEVLLEASTLTYAITSRPGQPS